VFENFASLFLINKITEQYKKTHFDNDVSPLESETEDGVDIAGLMRAVRLMGDERRQAHTEDPRFIIWGPDEKVTHHLPKSYVRLILFQTPVSCKKAGREKVHW
jgi:hypothetical protein